MAALFQHSLVELCYHAAMQLLLSVKLDAELILCPQPTQRACCNGCQLFVLGAHASGIMVHACHLPCLLTVKGVEHLKAGIRFQACVECGCLLLGHSMCWLLC